MIISLLFVLNLTINPVKSGQAGLNRTRTPAVENLQNRDQQLFIRLRLLSEGGEETEAGAEDDDETAGEARVPHVGDLIDTEVEPPGAGSLRVLH